MSTLSPVYVSYVEQCRSWDWLNCFDWHLVGTISSGTVIAWVLLGRSYEAAARESASKRANQGVTRAL